MDERRKTIKELELLRQEALRLNSRLLEELGESLLVREGASPGPAGEDTCGASFETFAGEYRRLCKEARDAGEAVKAIEADTRRLKQIGETLALVEEGLAAGRQDRDRLYTLLGERIMDDTALGELTDPFKRQLDALGGKIRGLEDQIGELEAQDSPNLFVRLGKNAKARFCRTSLEKNHAGMRRIYEALGKKFALLEDREAAQEGPAAQILGEIGQVQEQLKKLEGESAEFRGEQQRISAALNVQGGAVRRIGTLEKQIDRVKKEIRALFEKCGAAAADRSGEFAPLLEGEDRILLQKIGESREALGDLENRIEKLKAALAIDEERGAIARMEKSIQGRRARISAEEAAVRDLEERIRKAEQHIEDLQKIEAYGVKD
jgi:tetratricopeptide (TPR) repeat protein